MAVSFTLPSLGENVDTVDVLRIFVSEGAAVAEGQPVVEVETGKATVEVPSSVAGTVKAIHVKPGQKVKVGHQILTVEGTNGGAAAVGARAAAKPVSAPPLPASPAADAAVAPAAKGPVGRSLPDSVTIIAARPLRAEGEAARAAVFAAPSVRTFAREVGVSIDEVAAAAADGRLTIDDVKANLRLRGGGTRGPALPPLPDFTKIGPVRREPMSGIRKVTAERLAAAWAAVPHVTQFDRADVSEVEDLRKRCQKSAEAEGAKLTMTAILVKVCATALRLFPKFNASVDAARHEVVYKDYVNIGVAVDTDRGLLVPVIRDADRKSAVALAKELAQAAEKARARRLLPDDLQGGNFTISNLGGLGGKHFAPIINPPEVAILGVGRAGVEPVWNGAEFRPRLMMPLALSYDHRLIDGADGTRFLRWLVEALEQPGRAVVGA